MGTVPITAEWALWGKAPGALDDYGVLACSSGRLGRDDFGEIMTRFAPGTPTGGLPQVTISWVGGGDAAHLGLAIQEWSDRQDAHGRDIAVTRYFCVPYGQVAQQRVTYGALYQAFIPHALPAAGPLAVKVPELDPHQLAKMIDESAMAVAALLLTGKPVCIVQGETAEMDTRLSFLDTVAALLPYGMRTRLTASTWTNSASQHRIKLSFAKHAPAGAHSVVWGQPVPVPYECDDANTYYQRLLTSPSQAGLVGRLAAAIEPLGFKDGCRQALRLLDDPSPVPAIRPSQDGPVSYEIDIDRLLIKIIEYAELPDVFSLKDQLWRLEVAVREMRFAEGDQTRWRDIILSGRLLDGRLARFPQIEAPLYNTLLAVAYGPRPTVDHIKGLLREIGTPHPELLYAILRMDTDQPAVKLLLARQLDTAEAEKLLHSTQTVDIVKLAADTPDDPVLVKDICSELVRRGGNSANDPALAEALYRHGYLVEAVQSLSREDGKGQYEWQRSLLTAAYGQDLGRAELAEIVRHSPGLESMPVLAALSLHGPGAMTELAHVIDAYGKGRIQGNELHQLRQALFEQGPPSPAIPGDRPGDRHRRRLTALLMNTGPEQHGDGWLGRLKRVGLTKITLIIFLVLVVAGIAGFYALALKPPAVPLERRLPESGTVSEIPAQQLPDTGPQTVPPDQQHPPGQHGSGTEQGPRPNGGPN